MGASSSIAAGVLHAASDRAARGARQGLRRPLLQCGIERLGARDGGIRAIIVLPEMLVPRHSMANQGDASRPSLANQGGTHQYRTGLRPVNDYCGWRVLLQVLHIEMLFVDIFDVLLRDRGCETMSVFQ